MNIHNPSLARRTLPPSEKTFIRFRRNCNQHGVYWVRDFPHDEAGGLRIETDSGRKLVIDKNGVFVNLSACPQVGHALALNAAAVSRTTGWYISAHAWLYTAAIWRKAWSR